MYVTGRKAATRNINMVYQYASSWWCCKHPIM